LANSIWRMGLDKQCSGLKRSNFQNETSLITSQDHFMFMVKTKKSEVTSDRLVTFLWLWFPKLAIWCHLLRHSCRRSSFKTLSDLANLFVMEAAQPLLQRLVATWIAVVVMALVLLKQGFVPAISDTLAQIALSWQLKLISLVALSSPSEETAGATSLLLQTLLWITLKQESLVKDIYHFLLEKVY
jgi:hypothetical protein